MVLIDTDGITTELMRELNLDEAEVETLRSAVYTSMSIVTKSIDEVPKKSKLLNGTIKTLATQMYYDRTLESGMSKGLLMMLTHLQFDKGDADES